MNQLSNSGRGQLFFFSASQDGTRFFRGVCRGVRHDGQRIELQGRSAVRWTIEPGGVEPRADVVPLASLTLTLRDFHVMVTEGPAPAWSG